MNERVVRMDVKITAYELAMWLKEEKSDGDYKIQSRAEMLFYICKNNYVKNVEPNVSAEDIKFANKWYPAISGCQDEDKPYQFCFKMLPTRWIISNIKWDCENYKSDDGKYLVSMPENSRVFCPSETNGFFKPEKYPEDEFYEASMEAEKYKRICKAVALAYKKYSKCNPDQIMEDMIKKAEKHYNALNESQDFWLKLYGYIDSTEKVDNR